MALTCAPEPPPVFREEAAEARPAEAASYAPRLLAMKGRIRDYRQCTNSASLQRRYASPQPQSIAAPVCW